VRKKKRMASPAYMANVSTFPTAKFRCANSPSSSIGSCARRSYTTKPMNDRTPALSGTKIAGSPHP
jgi:hypothetical protein